MPRYWILVMVEENYLLAKARGLIGMSKGASRGIQQMQVGDPLTFYISKKRVDSPANDPGQRVQQFRGMARVSSEVFESDERIWPARAREIFRFRRRVEFLSDASADVRLLIDKLSFVTNTLFWALPLRPGYVEVKPKDFETIQEAMQASRVGPPGSS